MSAKRIATLQYITFQPTPQTAYYQQIELLLQSGLRWIQYRDKLNDNAIKKQLAKQLQALCKAYQATFIINDDVDLALQLDADGVHVGQTDLSVPAARKILGDDKIIGTSSNHLSHIKKAIADGADYSGIGPLHYTATKSQLNPIIGYERLQQLFNTLKVEQIEFPLVVIGGIQFNDVPLLLEIGAKGIALSAALAKADSGATATTDFLKALPNAYF